MLRFGDHVPVLVGDNAAVRQRPRQAGRVRRYLGWLFTDEALQIGDYYAGGPTPGETAGRSCCPRCGLLFGAELAALRSYAI
ncbi:hypothetical protein [Mycobacterium lepromatosis]|uniref:hypothetical protein n=1 Tax=Mycobacterium lepromatosis TaxID=480418 RepID=UPI0005F7E0F4|nr:hypothetical protein [Mycobacterium lepromatosis]